MKENWTTSSANDVFVFGTDEAGYGPNLGPLVVGSSSWRVAQGATSEIATSFFSEKKRAFDGSKTLFDLEEEEPSVGVDAFADAAIGKLTAALAPISSSRGLFPLVDSKKLYASKSLAALERSFTLACALTSRLGASFRETLALMAGETRDDARLPIWERDVDLAPPLDPKTTFEGTLAESAARAESTLAASGAALLGVSARRVHPAEYNATLDALALKSELIAEFTTTTLAEAIAGTLDSRGKGATPALCLALCDKLGGRDRYRNVLTRRFPNGEITTLRESRESSVYRIATDSFRGRTGALVPMAREIALEIRFTAKGERWAPTALASICAKYLREASMKLFNDFWTSAVDFELAPTAGYPVDAARFRAEVERTRVGLGIEEDAFWRRK